MPYYGDEPGNRPDPYQKMSFGTIPKVNESIHLRAQGNLSYLDFIRLLVELWTEANPQIPMYATGTMMETVGYPVMLYKLEMRRPFENEPKAKQREKYRTPSGEDEITVFGQRFNNSIVFTVYTQDDPQAAEEIIEMFEDFMIEYIPIFKQLGLSDIFYGQRLPDAQESRSGRFVITRAIAYRVITEKLVKSSAWKLQKALVAAQKFFADATPVFDADDPSLEQDPPTTIIIDNDTTQP